MYAHGTLIVYELLPIVYKKVSVSIKVTRKFTQCLKIDSYTHNRIQHITHAITVPCLTSGPRMIHFPNDMLVSADPMDGTEVSTFMVFSCIHSFSFSNWFILRGQGYSDMEPSLERVCAREEYTSLLNWIPVYHKAHTDVQ